MDTIMLKGYIRFKYNYIAPNEVILILDLKVLPWPFLGHLIYHQVYEINVINIGRQLNYKHH